MSDQPDYTTPHPFSTSLFRALKLDPTKIGALKVEIDADDIPTVWASYVTDEIVDGEVVLDERWHVVETDVIRLRDARGLASEITESLTSDSTGTGFQVIINTVEAAIDALHELGYNIVKVHR